MIGIRSITYQLPKDYNTRHLNTILSLSRKWATDDYFIRTQRVSLVPFTKEKSLDHFNELSKLCNASDIRWFNVPLDPWETENQEDLFKFGESLLAAYENVFVNILTFKNGKADTEILQESAKLIKKNSLLNKNGKDNFRLGLSSNIDFNGPFFPFSMSSGDFGFSIALELTQEINRISDKYNSLPLIDFRDLLKRELEMQISVIEKTAEKMAEKFNVIFHGFDFSIAPIIADDGSVLTVLHRLGIYNFGKTGTMFATAYLTDLIKSFKSKFKTVGFSGVMYSLLEDLELCMINNERGISIEELLKVSTMCGCGVDMVPVPGDITTNEMITIFMEVYAISTKLNKPLGIRILPIPNCKRSQVQYTNLYEDADFIANTKILNLDINIIDNIGDVFYLYNKV